ncbi:MAG: HAMP domain-containing histidine kinase [Aphanothece sp. CMT-3BRIN-NPC111]|nr:HAMP domain-containing histidine kinase [Aphanothece sp. CMT-3BRIN-NPC111]
MESNRFQQWSRVIWGTRSRFLAWYVVLMAVSALVSILAIRQVLFLRLEKRIEKSLAQEVEEFRQLVRGRNPTTGEFFGDDVSSLFKVFLSRNIPNDDEFLLTLLDGKLYSSSPSALPKYLQENSDLIKRWAKLTQPKRGQTVILDGTILYLTEPVFIGKKMRGTFIVVHSTAGERNEIDEAVIAITQVTIAVLAAASILAWVAAGRVLAPLWLLTETARSIRESDLTGRLPVKGSDEIAELSITFNQMLDRLQSAFASQRDFINDAGHELRTPLTIIRGHLELLEDNPQERQETLEVVMDELDRMNRFVDDLILLAKAEQPDFLVLKTVDISSLTEELYIKAKALADRDWRLESKGKGLIVADRQRITQAVMNLAQNATQHTKIGDVIAIGSTLSAQKACFWVRDTGEGISLADQERIFQRFARGTNSRRRSDGAGLGLAIVQAIAEAHGGSVELLSQLGEGSIFTLVIPLAHS